MAKELDWLKRNKQYLNLSAIARDSKIHVRLMHGVVNEQADGHGTPFKIPEAKKQDLINLIKEIQKK